MQADNDAEQFKRMLTQLDVAPHKNLKFLDMEGANWYELLGTAASSRNRKLMQEFLTVVKKLNLKLKNVAAGFFNLVDDNLLEEFA